MPVSTRSGELIAEFTYEDKARHASLFHWIDGEDVGGELTLPTMERIGEAIAHLHNAARAFIPPSDFDRPRYDWIYIAGVFEWQKHTHAVLSDTDREILTNAALKVIAEMEHLGTEPEVFGLIHSDLHFGNFLGNGDAVSVIDFGDLGFGHYVLDLMMPVLELNDDPPKMKARLEALLDGYQRVAPLPYQTNRQMAIFIMAQSLIFLEWVFTAENPEVKEKKLQWVQSTVDGIARTLEILDKQRG